MTALGSKLDPRCLAAALDCYVLVRGSSAEADAGELVEACARRIERLVRKVEKSPPGVLTAAATDREELRIVRPPS